MHLTVGAAWIPVIIGVAMACLPGLKVFKRATWLLEALTSFLAAGILLATYDVAERNSDSAVLPERHGKALQLLQDHHKLPSFGSLAKHVAAQLSSTLKLADAAEG